LNLAYAISCHKNIMILLNIVILLYEYKDKEERQLKNWGKHYKCTDKRKMKKSKQKIRRKEKVIQDKRKKRV